MEVIVNSVFGTAVVAAFVTAIFTYINTKKRNELEHITAERKEWRQDLREIAEKINRSKTVDDLHDNLVPLKVRINPTKRVKYLEGKSDSQETKVLDPSDIDEMLWMEISKIEDELVKPGIFNLVQTKREIIRLIEGILKYDWERSKNEVKEDKSKKVANVASSIGILFFFIGALGGVIRFLELSESEGFFNTFGSVSYVLVSDFTVFLSVLALLFLTIMIVKDGLSQNKKLYSKDRDTTILIKIIRLGSVGIIGIIGIVLFMFYIVDIIEIFIQNYNLILTGGDIGVIAWGSLVFIMIIGVIIFIFLCLNSNIEVYVSAVLIFSIASIIYQIMFKPGIHGTYYLLALIISFGCMVLSAVYSIKSQQLKNEQLKIVKLIKQQVKPIQIKFKVIITLKE